MIVFPAEDLNPTRTRPYVNYLIMAVMFIVFLVFGLRSDYQEILARYAFVPSDPTWRGALQGLFFHADLPHLMMNLAFLAILADNVEDSLGHFGFALFFVATGLFSEYAQMMSVSEARAGIPVMGSSGAVSAVVGAYALVFPHARILFRGFVWVIYYFRALRFTLPSRWMVLFWFVLQFLAIYAHFGTGNLNVVSLGGGFMAGMVAVGLVALFGLVDLQWEPPAFVPDSGELAGEGADCPGCLQRMELARVDDVEVDLCRHCGGLWLDKGELDRLVEGDSIPPELLDPPAEEEEGVLLKEGERVCPRCQGPFRLLEFRGTVVEHCKTCGGMWLEKGELGQLLGKG